MMNQRTALLVLTAALALLAIWILRHFLPALAWAAVLAIATWPLYARFLGLFPGHRLQHRLWAPLLFTLMVGVVFVLPLTWFAIEVGRETLFFVRWARTIEQTGLAAPDWVGHVPFGGYLATWWQANLADPEAAKVLIGRIDRSVLFEWTRSIGIQLLARSTILVFTLMALFFLYRDGRAFGRQIVALASRSFGPAGEDVGQHVVAAVRGTVDGLVLVGLVEGVLLGIRLRHRRPAACDAARRGDLRTGDDPVRRADHFRIVRGVPARAVERQRGGGAGRLWRRDHLHRRPFRATGADRRHHTAAVSVGAAGLARRRRKLRIARTLPRPRGDGGGHDAVARVGGRAAHAGYGSISTPGLSRPCGSSALFAARERLGEQRRALAVVPRAVIAPDRVMMGDGAAGRDQRVGGGAS